VVGDGPDRRRLERIAGPTVRFVGRVPDGSVAEHLSRARALIVPAEEDFGIAPLEANACGRPVVAFSRGGALETVVPANGYPGWLTVRPAVAPEVRRPTGVFFHEQTPEAVQSAMGELESRRFEPVHLREHSLEFDEAVFKGRIASFVEEAWATHRDRHLTLRFERYRPHARVGVEPAVRSGKTGGPDPREDL
jgi:glycosyltransferase involved in cell wall biosynthesis